MARLWRVARCQRNVLRTYTKGHHIHKRPPPLFRTLGEGLHEVARMALRDASELGMKRRGEQMTGEKRRGRRVCVLDTVVR